MSLLKIPFILLQVIGFYVSLTPPNPPPPRNQQIKPGNILERCLRTTMSYKGVELIKYIPLTVGLTEIAVLLANRYPSYSISSTVLETLLFHPGGSKTIGFTWPAITGSGLAMTGGAIRLWCYRTLDRFFTFELSIRPDHRLITAGPYNYVRHPSYTGVVMSYFGGLFILFSRGGWTRESGVLDTAAGKVVTVSWAVMMGVVAVTLLHRTWTEDRMMKERFGEEWGRWAEKVRWKVIPGIF